ncbi:hypothetical protein AXX17_AT1G64820 [Arabidopsis thaliana]|uniref:Uncharacterized protein n=1 Tax=Arabidopsis thaliana TaxID=3702 RepID=A0A178W440_ARATH|nr:hypothetical protein AXX17_AT1G64820 [Arabidopsis thaliana]
MVMDHRFQKRSPAAESKVRTVDWTIKHLSDLEHKALTFEELVSKKSADKHSSAKLSPDFNSESGEV